MRVTKAELQHKVDFLNKLTGSAWRLSQAYGGYAVVRVVTAGGGESHLFRHLGHMPAKDLNQRLSAYTQGIEDTTADQYCYCDRCGTSSECTIFRGMDK